MIISEPVPNRPNVARYYSDQGLIIENKQTGEQAPDFIDLEGVYEYTETDVFPELPNDTWLEYDAFHILIGE